MTKSRIRWAGNVASMEELRNEYKMLVGKSEGERRPLGRPRCGWEDDIIMDLREAGLEVVD
jgi:hypothetical protein